MTLHRLDTLTTFVVLAALISACAVDVIPAPPSATEGDPPAAQEGSMLSSPTPPGAELQGLARSVLSAWLRIPEDQVEVTLAEPIEWPDASLGCPQPGLAYAQAVTPGFRFTLEASGQSYFVHTDLGVNAVVCLDSGVLPAPVFPVTPGAIDDAGPWMPAD